MLWHQVGGGFSPGVGRAAPRAHVKLLLLFFLLSKIMTPRAREATHTQTNVSKQTLYSAR